MYVIIIMVGFVEEYLKKYNGEKATSIYIFI